MTEHAAPPALVAPRHIAGAGEAGIVTAHLREHNWRDLLEPGSLRTYLESPDATIRLCLEPNPERPWWAAVGTPPNGELWHAAFEARTPAEMILAFAQGLTHPDRVPDEDLFDVLTDAGWTRPFARNSYYKRQAPDQLALWDLRRDDEVTDWYARCRVYGEPLWSAVLSAHTPRPAVTAFATALAGLLPRSPAAIPAAAHKFLARRTAVPRRSFRSARIPRRPSASADSRPPSLRSTALPASPSAALPGIGAAPSR
ncbi:DUF317 domain-containing protein [Streptomyces sp. CAS3]